MGAFFEGFDAARKQHAEQMSEQHQREVLIDGEIQGLVALLDTDAKLMKENNVSHEFAGRALRINHNRSPAIMVRFDPVKKIFELTVMRDGSQGTWASLEDCAKAIGAHVFQLTLSERAK